MKYDYFESMKEELELYHNDPTANSYGKALLCGIFSIAESLRVITDRLEDELDKETK